MTGQVNGHVAGRAPAFRARDPSGVREPSWSGGDTVWAMTDPVWPLPADEEPGWGMHSGCGTWLMHNTRPDADGRFFATAWLLILVPIAPLARYWVRQGKTESNAEQDTIHYEVFGGSRVRVVETLKTYLHFAVTLALGFAPVWVGVELSEGYAVDPLWLELGVVVAPVILIGLYITAWALLYRRRWRPVRGARMVPSRPSRGSRRGDR